MFAVSLSECLHYISPGSHHVQIRTGTFTRLSCDEMQIARGPRPPHWCFLLLSILPPLFGIWDTMISAKPNIYCLCKRVISNIDIAELPWTHIYRSKLSEDNDLRMVLVRARLFFVSATTELPPKTFTPWPSGTSGILS